MSNKIEQLKSDLHSKFEHLQDETALELSQEAVTAYPSSQNENVDELTAGNKSVCGIYSAVQ